MLLQNLTSLSPVDIVGRVLKIGIRFRYINILYHLFCMYECTAVDISLEDSIAFAAKNNGNG